MDWEAHAAAGQVVGASVRGHLRTMKDMRCRLRLLLNCRLVFGLAISLLLILIPRGLCADGPVFDLAGPKVDVRVKRGEVTLPIGQVPNLLPGDRLWIHPDFPKSQSAHFVLVVAFLRGATNPPPDAWFTRVETWNGEAREEGVFVMVPQEAQQALVFLAPETGGDFSTLRKAVERLPVTVEALAAWANALVEQGSRRRRCSDAQLHAHAARRAGTGGALAAGLC